MSYDIGAKVGIEGEAEFKKAIKEIDTNIRTLSTGLKASTSAFNKNDKSIQNLTSQNKNLAKQIDVLNNKSTLYSERLNKENETLSKLQYSLEKSTLAFGKNSEVVTKAKSKYDAQVEVVEKLQQKQNKTTAALNKSELQLKNNTTSIKNHNSEIVKATMKTDEMRNAQKKMKGVLNAVKVAVLGVASGLVLSAKAAIDYESAFTGVRKTVDGTETELSAISEGIRDMAKEIPVSASELAKIAENAGQLGIQTDNIMGFTRVMADLGVATNLTGEEAAQTLAKFANITQMPQSEFDRLGSTIVDLGNNSATTEADIAAMALRLAGAGEQSGMTEAEILGFSAALSSLGIEAEAGGSAFSKVFNKINVAVQTGSAELKDFSKVAGMTSADFQKSFNENAAGAVTKFIEGLGSAGNKAVVILGQMGIDEVRLKDALLRTSGAGDLLTNSVNMATSAWQNNNALTAEAEKRYETTASQLQILKNTVVDAAIEIGNKLLPQIKALTEKLKNEDFSLIINGFKWIIDNGKLIISTAVAIGAGMAVWNVAQTIFAVVQAIRVWKGAMDMAKLSQVGLNVAMASNPIGLVITAIAALTAGLVAYSLMSDRAVSASKVLYDETVKLGEEYRNTTAEIKKSEAADYAKAQTAKDLTETLYYLDEQVRSGTLSEEQAVITKEKMHSIADQLRRLIPNVAIAFDGETGSIITQRREVESLIDSFLRLAKAKAAAAKMTEIETTILEAKVNIKAAENKKSESTKNLEEWFKDPPFITWGEDSKKVDTWAMDVKNSTGAIKEGNKIIAEAEKERAALKEIIDEENIDIESVTDSVKEQGDAFNSTGAAAKSAGGAAKSAADETEKATKEAEKAAKEAAEEEKKRIDKLFKDHKFNLDMQYISEADYYKGLEILRDTYFEIGTDDWQKYTLEIAQYQKKTFEDAKKDIENAFADITKSVTANIDEITKARDGLTAKLNDYNPVFKKIKITEADGNVSEFFDIGNMDKVNKDLEQYRDLLLAVKERGADKSIFDALRNLDVTEAVEKSKVLLGVSDEEFARMNEGFRKSRELNAEISADLFTSDYEIAVQEGMKEVFKTLNELSGDYKDLGENYAVALGEGFKSAISGVFSSIKEGIFSELQSINLITGKYSTAGNVSNSYSPTINLYGSNLSPADAASASKKEYSIFKLRGFGK